ncbi:MAG: hypothetical protein Q9198_000743 [Flavoplaca austrocitrina]
MAYNLSENINFLFGLSNYILSPSLQENTQKKSLSPEVFFQRFYKKKEYWARNRISISQPQYTLATIPFEDHFRNPFSHDHYNAANHPTASTTNQEIARKHPNQLDHDAKHRHHEERRQQQKQEKEEKRQDLLDKRYKKECERAQEQRQHRQQKRREGKRLGNADNLGEDPLSDVKLVKHAVGVEVRKRMPGLRGEDPRDRR